MTQGQEPRPRTELGPPGQICRSLHPGGRGRGRDAPAPAGLAPDPSVRVRNQKPRSPHKAEQSRGGEGCRGGTGSGRQANPYNWGAVPPARAPAPGALMSETRRS